jgi:hypothetical protein
MGYAWRATPSLRAIYGGRRAGGIGESTYGGFLTRRVIALLGRAAGTHFFVARI